MSATRLRALSSFSATRPGQPAAGTRRPRRLAVGTLALALARYGAAPDAALAEQLRHELARDTWLVGADARRRWGEQAAVALKLGVTPAS